MTSQATTSAAAFGLVGLPNHGSNRIVWPPGVDTSTHEWPYQVIVVAIARTSAAILSPGSIRPGRYTRPVPAERIAESLAFINWTILTGLAIGSFGGVGLGRFRADPTRGDLGVTGVGAVVLGVL